MKPSFASIARCENLDELSAACQRLRENGWELQKCDQPDEGIIGWIASKDCNHQSSPLTTTTWLRCEVYGKALEPHVTVYTTAKDFIEALELHLDADMEKSDNPETRQVGFVSYRRALEGKSDVFRVGVGALKEDSSAKSVLMGIWLKAKGSL